jgi:hypothetical protein
LNLKNSETDLMNFYKNLIHSAVVETHTDTGKLDAKLKVIYKAASYEGLSATDVDRLVQEVIPNKQTYPKTG